MKKLLSRITIALFVTLSACYPVHVMADEGRYQATSAPTPNSIYGTGIWIVDTKTGKVKACYLNNIIETDWLKKSIPFCTIWSKD